MLAAMREPTRHSESQKEQMFGTLLEMATAIATADKKQLPALRKQLAPLVEMAAHGALPVDKARLEAWQAVAK
jgi:hypothetical protein